MSPELIVGLGLGFILGFLVADQLWRWANRADARLQRELDELSLMRDEDIDTSDIPETSLERISHRDG